MASRGPRHGSGPDCRLSLVWVGRGVIAVAFGWGLAVLAVVFNVLLVLFDCLINPTGFGSRYMNAGGMKYVTGRRETRLQSLSELTDSE